MQSLNRVHTLLSSSNFMMTFHDYSHDHYNFSMTLGLAVTFENFKNFPYFSIFIFTLNSSTDTNSDVHQNACYLHCLISPLDLKLFLLCK